MSTENISIKNTYTEYTFPNGQTIKCTVAFRFLLKLREKNKRIYQKMNDGLLMGVKELAESAYVLYGAYLCACYAGENGGEESIIPEGEFIGALEDDLVNVMIKCTEFINKKKN